MEKPALLAFSLLAACSTGYLSAANSDGGATDLGAACASATDTASCQAIPGCQAVGCQTCDGEMSFSFCIPKGQPYGLLCPNPCAQPACDQLTDPTACDARSDCYARYSGDLPCNNSSCQNHFIKCESAPPICDPPGAACGVSCTMLTPSCRPGYASVFPSSSSCCSNGCVASTKCPSSAPCTADDQCGAQAYCRGQLSACSGDCQLTIGTAATGTCHRSCVGPDALCSCVDDSDCPGFFTSCDLPSGICTSIEPPICHATCPAGCTDATDVEYGEICVCSVCTPSP